MRVYTPDITQIQIDRYGGKRKTHDASSLDNGGSIKTAALAHISRINPRAMVRALVIWILNGVSRYICTSTSEFAVSPWSMLRAERYDGGEKKRRVKDNAGEKRSRSGIVEMVGLDLRLQTTTKYGTTDNSSFARLSRDPFLKLRPIEARKYQLRVLRLLRARCRSLPGFPTFDLRSVFTLITIARSSIAMKVLLPCDIHSVAVVQLFSHACCPVM